NLMNSGGASRQAQSPQLPYGQMPSQGQAPQGDGATTSPVPQSLINPPPLTQGAPQAGLMGPQDQAPMQPSPTPQAAANPYAALMPQGMSPQTFGLMSLLYPQAASSV